MQPLKLRFWKGIIVIVRQAGETILPNTSYLKSVQSQRKVVLHRITDLSGFWNHPGLWRTPKRSRNEVQRTALEIKTTWRLSQKKSSWALFWRLPRNNRRVPEMSTWHRYEPLGEYGGWGKSYWRQIDVPVISLYCLRWTSLFPVLFGEQWQGLCK